MTESEEVASEPEETSDSGDLEEEESVRHGVVTVTTNNVKVGIYIINFMLQTSMFLQLIIIV